MCPEKLFNGLFWWRYEERITGGIFRPAHFSFMSKAQSITQKFILPCANKYIDRFFRSNSLHLPHYASHLREFCLLHHQILIVNQQHWQSHSFALLRQCTLTAFPNGKFRHFCKLAGSLGQNCQGVILTEVPSSPHVYDLSAIIVTQIIHNVDDILPSVLNLAKYSSLLNWPLLHAENCLTNYCA